MNESTLDLHAKQKLLKWLMGGLIKGINRFFAQPTAVALVIQFSEGGPVYFYDPYGCLADKQKEIMDYIQSQKREATPFKGFITFQPEFAEEPLPYNCVWFAKPTLDHVSNEIIQSWLSCAQDMMNVDFSNFSRLNREARWAIEHFERHVVKMVIAKRNIELPVGSIVSSMMELSGALEEGERATGSLVFDLHGNLDKYTFIAKLTDHVPLKSTKLTRKLLTVTQPGTALFSDGELIVGVVSDNLSSLPCLQADFNEGVGQLRVGEELICRIKDRALISNPLQVDLSTLESVLVRRQLPQEPKSAMLHFVKKIVEHARSNMHGCTLVLDFRSNPVPFTPIGQNLSSPISLTNEREVELACQMAGVDGALHLDMSPCLRAFGCILPYRFEAACTDATAARGARFNSALCFSSNEPDTLTLVVSEDGPMSVFENGHVLNMRKEPGHIEVREVSAVGSR